MRTSIALLALTLFSATPAAVADALEQVPTLADCQPESGQEYPHLEVSAVNEGSRNYLKMAIQKDRSTAPVSFYASIKKTRLQRLEKLLNSRSERYTMGPFVGRIDGESLNVTFEGVRFGGGHYRVYANTHGFGGSSTLSCF